MDKKLYVIESGSDGSGKKTQTRLLYENLTKSGVKAEIADFPNYKSPSSYALRLYLKGQFSSDAGGVNAYAASSFFSIDRYVTFKQKFFKIYNQGATIIANRYTTSNMLYQGGKIDSPKERELFFEWLENLEYDIYGLPRPTRVFYLDIPFETSYEWLNKRRQRKNIRDIHEEDRAYLEKVYNISLETAKSRGWTIINCESAGRLLSPEEINRLIMENIDEG